MYSRQILKWVIISDDMKNLYSDIFPQNCIDWTLCDLLQQRKKGKDINMAHAINNSYILQHKLYCLRITWMSIPWLRRRLSNWMFSCERRHVLMVGAAADIPLSLLQFEGKKSFHNGFTGSQPEIQLLLQWQLRTRSICSFSTLSSVY